MSFALYALKAKGMPMRELARQAEVIRQDLLHVPGVKKINILGESLNRYSSSFPMLLATLGVSAQDIVAALQRQNTVTPAGSIDTQGPQVFIRVDGAYDSVQAIADTPIVAAGRTLKLSDIAEVRRGYEDPPTYLIRHVRVSPPSCSRRYAGGLGWSRARQGAGGQDCGHRTDATGMTLDKVTDQAVNIASAVDEFMMKFAMALGVVLLVSLAASAGASASSWRGRPADARRRVHHAGDRPVLRPHHARRSHPGARSSRGRRHHRHRGDGGEDGRGHDRIKAAAYAWSHTAAPMLSGTLVTIAGFLPVGFGALDGRRIRRQHLLGRGVRPHRPLDRRGGLHALSRRQDAARDQTDRRRSPRDLRHTELSASATAHHLCRAPQIRNLRYRRHRLRAFRRRHGRLKQQFPTSDRPEVLVEVRLPEGASIETTTLQSRSARTGWTASPRPRSSRAMSVRAPRASSSRWRRNCPILPSPRSSC